MYRYRVLINFFILIKNAQQITIVYYSIQMYRQTIKKCKHSSRHIGENDRNSILN